MSTYTQNCLPLIILRGCQRGLLPEVLCTGPSEETVLRWSDVQALGADTQPPNASFIYQAGEEVYSFYLSKSFFSSVK